MDAIFSLINQRMRAILARSQPGEDFGLILSDENRQLLFTNAIGQHDDDDDDDQLISSFLELAVGQTVETARMFLQSTNWNIDEAINLFLISHDIAAAPSEDLASDDSRLSSLYHPPLKLLLEGSFEDAKLTSSQKNQWLIVNLQSRTEFASHRLNRDVWSNDAVSQTVESSFVLWQVYDHTIEGKKISTFYKIESAPPVVLVIDPITGQKMRMWSGEIEAHGFVEDLMRFLEAGPHEHIASLTRNIRSKTKETLPSSSNNTDQVATPSWGEEIEKEETCSSSNRINQVVAPSFCEEFENEETCSSNSNIDQILAPFWGEEFNEETLSSNNNYDHMVAPSLGPEFEESAEVKEEEETCLEFPDLTEEPKGDCDRSLVCSLCVRFPDGRRKQRKFLNTEPIQLLWSFCYSQMEASEKKAFKLVQAIPGASKTLDYEANTTFDQSGLANSMISVTWE